MDSSNLERSASSPMATSCVFISTIFLLLAIFFGLYNIGEMRESDAGKNEDPVKLAGDDAKDFRNKAKAAISDIRDEFPEFAPSEEEEGEGESDDEGDDLEFDDEEDTTEEETTEEETSEEEEGEEP